MKLFASRLIGTDSKNKREIKGKNLMRVVLRTVSLAFFHCVERNLSRGEKGKRQVGPVTNDSQVNLMTKLR